MSDVRSLELRTSTCADAERLSRKWRAWGHYQGTCTSAELDIELQDLLLREIERHPNIWERSRWLLKPYLALGGRPVQIFATVKVIDGKVWGKNFGAHIEVVSAVPFADYDYTLIGRATTESRFVPGFLPQVADHNEYLIGTPSGCMDCVAVYTEFTPYVSQHDSERLMDFNLDCITRWRPCTEKAEIMPAAWNELTGTAKSRVSWDDLRKCNYPIDVLARDASDAVIAEVLRNRIEVGAEPYQVSRMRLVSPLKGARFWRPETEQDVRVFDGTVSGTAHNLPGDVVPGKQFILLFSRGKISGPDGPDVWLDQCGCIPATDTNLAVVRAGIDRDFESKLNGERSNP